MKVKQVPEVHVGILLAETIGFRMEGPFGSARGGAPLSGAARALVEKGQIEVRLDGRTVARGRELLFTPLDKATSRFAIGDVVIGIGFHWEQKEEQFFRGAIKLVISGGKIRVVNIVSIEDYLVSVISSEMSGGCAPALLKAHAIISRSWLLAQIGKQDTTEPKAGGTNPLREPDQEYIRWYNREDHTGFHVCADDHCQRYQGVTRASNPEVEKAVEETFGEVLMHGGRICDARFSKCCGGVTEKFENCWEPVEHPYLQRVDDNPAGAGINGDDLKIESKARAFIKGSPDAFCNTGDTLLLRQVLNDYDLTSGGFYRWKVCYTREEISELIREKSGLDFGMIRELVPVQRGESGRLVKLKIVGTKKTLTIGKELEIRRWLSKSHLYSAAFVVETTGAGEGIPEQFTLYGAGWGHGAGLCQIGAAVMAGLGYTHQEILTHYYKEVTIERRYEKTL
ncbi:MAG: SpoIID/LytB domain-containing protein [Bacteroidota bacterium]